MGKNLENERRRDIVGNVCNTTIKVRQFSLVQGIKGKREEKEEKERKRKKKKEKERKRKKRKEKETFKTSPTMI